MDTSPLATTPISSPESIPPLNPTIFANTFPQAPATTTPPAPLPSFMDATAAALSPASQPITGVPTPPSMVDPNLNFDWDQWDAVFGQHLPVADELMELDPVTGFEFGDLGSAARVVPGARTGSSMAGSEAGMSEVHGSDWVGYC